MPAPAPAGAVPSEGAAASAAPAPAPSAALEEIPAGASAPAAPVGSGGDSAGDAAGPPKLRELDKAPLHLRKAALITAVGCLLPFLGSDAGIVTLVAAKVLALAGVWLWYKQVLHDFGPKEVGFLGRLASIDLGKLVKGLAKKKVDPSEAKPRRRAAVPPPGAAVALQHPFPTALHVVSFLVMVTACVVLPLLDPREGANAGKGMAEVGMLTWAAFTRVHIDSYERWGKFSPIFPLMFLGMVVAGAAGLVRAFGYGLGSPSGIAALLGGALVAAGGTLAAYTIVEALMQAKKEGDVKKQAALEARRAARKARGGGAS